MSKLILITGATDGIGLATAEMLIANGHQVLVHGRSEDKAKRVVEMLQRVDANGVQGIYIADLSSMDQVKVMAEDILKDHSRLDAVINNAGVFAARSIVTEDNLELRFAVNTYAPYLLTKLLLPILDKDSRVVNLSSAAQSPVDLEALANGRPMTDDAAYAQSKLALTMWSMEIGEDFTKKGGPMVVAVNPKSFLGSKMVREAYGMQGHDLRIGADILMRAALSDEFANASGRYYDNDQGAFANPYPDALSHQKRQELIACMDQVLDNL